MISAAMMTTTGGAAELPNGVWKKFKAILKRDKAEFVPLGVGASPLLALGLGLARDGGSRNANYGNRQSLQSWRGRIKEGIEGGEDKHMHTRKWKWALYVEQIALPMPLRVQWRKGVDRCGSSSMPSRQQQRPAHRDWRWAAVVVVCCPQTGSTIWDWRSFGREEEDKDNDGNGLQERDHYNGTMMTTNDCSGCGRRNPKGQGIRNILAIGRQWRWHRGTSCRPPPPWPVVGRHHSREEECGLETLSSLGNVIVDNDDGANDNGQFQMVVPPLINKQCNASFRQTDAMRKMHFNKLRGSLSTG